MIVNNNHFSVLSKNGLCSIQDKGRMSSQHLGFTAGGASDEYAFLAANYLVGNYLKDNSLKDNCLETNKVSPTQLFAALEITLGQITVKSHQHCSIAITGANCFTTLNNCKIENWKVHQLKPNDVLTFATPKKGLHTYLAVYGGIQGKEWLGSQAQSFSEQLLGFGEPPIVVGSNIKLANICAIEENKLNSLKPVSNAFYGTDDIKVIDSIHTQKSNKKTPSLMLRFLPQPLWFKLNSQQQAQFLAQPFSISSQSNRMGYRLSNVPKSIQPTISAQAPTLSKPVTYGTIQLPTNGQPIVLMKERQTIGGYPVLGCVIQTDLFRLSQLRPGEMVQFITTSLPFAQQQIKALSDRFST